MARRQIKRKPVMFMRKRSTAGTVMTQHANSCSTLSKSVGVFIDPNNKGS